MIKQIKSIADVEKIIQEIGFLPFFANEIEGFSIEDNILPGLWFSAETDGPWEWKGPIARNGKCVYGKFFGGKAGFISLKYFPDFANYRRDGYDYEGFYEDGKARFKDKAVYDAISERGSYLSKALKRDLNYRKGGNKGFDTVITRLQNQTFVCIADFEYAKTKYGEPYGWGIARYSTPENIFGESFFEEVYKTQPEHSKEKIFYHLKSVLKNADENKILKFIG